MDVAATVLVQLFLMYLAATAAGALCECIKQPAVIGELLAGAVLGPFALGWVGLPTAGMIEALHGEAAATETLHTTMDMIAELGVIVLLFTVGLETRLSDILSVGLRASLVAIAGILVPFALGYTLIAALGLPTIEAIFVATAMVATSVGITARVLTDLGRIQSTEARVILGAAVIDDILGMVILAVVSGLGEGNALSFAQIGLIAAQALAFTAFVALAGRHAAQRWSMHLERIPVRDAPFVVAVLLMLGLAALAAWIGLAAIIGAFLAGMILAELREQFELERQTRPVYRLLVPLFFVITGSRVDWHFFLDGSLISIALVVTAAAIVGKLLGCGVAAIGLGGWRSSTIVGVGMVPRGEVGLIVANVGASLGVIPVDMLSTVVVMSVVTTLIVPPCLTVLYRLPSRRVGPLPAPGQVGAEG